MCCCQQSHQLEQFGQLEFRADADWLASASQLTIYIKINQINLKYITLYDI